MAEHDLKCAPEPFEAIRRGDKTHEFRKDDRGYALGDVLHLHEYLPALPDAPEVWGDSLRVRVTYVSRGPDWGIPEGYCCMSIRRAALEKKP